MDNYKQFFDNHPGLEATVSKLTDSLKKQAETFYNSDIVGYKVSDYVLRPNILLVHEVVINAVVDIVRISDFHPVERPTRYKYAAYIGYWWLRIKPLCLKEYSDAEFGIDSDETLESIPYAMMTSINEIFACDFMVAMITRCKTINNGVCPDLPNVTDNFGELMGSLIYFMQYRPFTAQQLEMYLKALNICPKTCV